MTKREVVNNLQILINIFKMPRPEFEKLLKNNEKYIISEMRKGTSMLDVAEVLRSKI